MWFEIFLYHILVVLIFARTSKYVKTNVLQNTCDYSNKLQEVNVKSEHHCALKCSESPDCRRYGFCVVSGNYICSLYSSGANCVTHLQPNQCKCYRKISTCENGICLCPIGYYGNNCENIITDCSHGHDLGWLKFDQMLSFVKPSLSPKPFEVLCHFKYGGLTHVLTRHSNCIPDYYNRSFAEYRQGFGDASTSHWIGLDKFFQMSKERDFRLNIFFSVGKPANYAQCYYTFSIMDAPDQFKLQLSNFKSHSSHICLDSWTNSVNISNAPFSTFDKDATQNNCPNTMGAGGWFSKTDPQCTRGNLFGPIDIWKDGLDNAPFKTIFLRIIA